MLNEVKQVLSNSIIFITLTGATHYIISKFLINDNLEQEINSKEEENCVKVECDTIKKIEYNTLDNTDEQNEKRKKIIQKKEELEDLYLKLVEIKNLIQNIHTNNN